MLPVCQEQRQCWACWWMHRASRSVVEDRDFRHHRLSRRTEAAEPLCGHAIMRKPLRRSRRLVLAASWQYKLKRKAAQHGINTCRVLHWYVRTHATDPRAYKPPPRKIYLHLEVTSNQSTQVSKLAKGLVLQHLCTHRHIGTSIMVVLTDVTCSSSRVLARAENRRVQRYDRAPSVIRWAQIS